MFSLIYANILRFLSLTAGSFYPAFVSFKLLKTHRQHREDNESTDNLHIWLTYWIVYGVWSMVDFLTTGLGVCFPFLGELKLIFICWLLPTLGAGSQMIYDECLYSFFINNEGTIEHALIHAALGVADFLDRLLRICLSHIMVVVDDYLLTRGLRQGTAANSIPKPSIDEYFAKLELEKKQKQEKTEDLEGTIEKALGEDTGRDDVDDNLSLNNSEMLDKTESDELVFSERNQKSKILTNNCEVLDKTETDECNKEPIYLDTMSEEEVFSECKLKPLIMPKPIKRQPSSLVQVTMELKTLLQPNQCVALADDDESEKTEVVSSK